MLLKQNSIFWSHCMTLILLHIVHIRWWIRLLLDIDIINHRLIHRQLLIWMPTNFLIFWGPRCGAGNLPIVLGKWVGCHNKGGFDREPLPKGRISTVGLLVLTSIDQLIFILKIVFTFVTKQAILTRRSTELSLPFQLVFPGQKHGGVGIYQSIYF